MKQCLLCLMVILLMAAAALADTPIWVDGNGNIISGPNGIVVGTVDTTESVPSISVSVGDDDSEYEGETGIPAETTAEDANKIPKWFYTPTTLMATYEGESVEVLALNTRLTRIKRDREELTVRTCELTFNTTAKKGCQMAMINTPKSGRATMFKRASSKAAIIYKCQTNRIVAVMDATKRFAHLHYADADGYVSTGSITYVEPWTGDIEVAYIAYKGKPTAKTTVKVRQKASGSSRVLDEFRCGTQVVVIGQNGKWTEIEVENLHAFILTEFLTEPVAWNNVSLMAAKEDIPGDLP